MIVAKTNLKKLPTRCGQCKFRLSVGSLINPKYMCGVTTNMLRYDDKGQGGNMVIYSKKPCPLIEINDNIIENE